MKKILVIGKDSSVAKSFLASRLTGNYAITATSRSPDKGVFLDLQNLESISNLECEVFDVAIVFAALSKTTVCGLDYEKALKVNSLSIGVLMGRIKCAHWIVFSTNLIFNGFSQNVPVDEAHQPFNEYGQTKSEMEKLVFESGRDVAIVRMTKVLLRKNLVLEPYLKMVSEDKKIEVFRDMNFSPVWIDDVVAFLFRLVQDFSGGVYQISASYDISYYEAMIYCAKKLKYDESLIQGVKKNLRSPSYTSLSVGQSEQKYNFVAKTPYQNLDYMLQSMGS